MANAIAKFDRFMQDIRDLEVQLRDDAARRETWRLVKACLQNYEQLRRYRLMRLRIRRWLNRCDHTKEQEQQTEVEP